MAIDVLAMSHIFMPVSNQRKLGNRMYIFVQLGRSNLSCSNYSTSTLTAFEQLGEWKKA